MQSPLLKASKEFEKIAIETRQKAIQYELEHYIQVKEDYIKPVFERRIGKSKVLVKLAHKYNLPIIVPLIVIGEELNEISKNLFGKPVNFVLGSEESLRGRRFDMVLVEEGFDESYIATVIKPKCNYVIGYVKEYH